MMKHAAILTIYLLTCIIYHASGRRHRLVLKNDGRDNILCSQFGFLKFGMLSVNLEKLEFQEKLNSYPMIGFTLDKAENAGIASYLETKSKKCVLTDPSIIKGSSLSVVYLKFDFKAKRLRITRIGRDLKKLNFISVGSQQVTPSQSVQSTEASRKDRRALLSEGEDQKPTTRSSKLMNEHSRRMVKIIRTAGFSKNAAVAAVSKLQEKNITEHDMKAAHSKGNLRQMLAHVINTGKSGKLSDPEAIPADDGDIDWDHTTELKNSSIPVRSEDGHFALEFAVTMHNEEDKGLYSLYFHNCDAKNVPVNMTLSLVEKNRNSYLSAGEQPLPLVYFAFCGAYFILSWVWLVVLRTSKKDVFKIHYVMLALVFVKSIALLFHGINNYVLGKEGIHEEGWAVMYYITYLMRGSLMLITLILIGAGWTYVKHMLHDREKKILLVGMSLHALRFVANIIIDESEIGSARYTTWKEIFILVDLLSVGLVLFPIVWSIRHLTKASRTDGKAAINLRRLKLFRHFYLLVICFIYTSRIIAYLLAITIPFTHTWLVELFREGATLIFFVITGYKFRPFNNNPYLLVPDVDMDEDTEEIQIEHVVAQSGFAEGTTRVNRSHKSDGVDGEENTACQELGGDMNPLLAPEKAHQISHEED